MDQVMTWDEEEFRWSEGNSWASFDGIAKDAQEI
jgi:hypothetical protein